MVIRRRSRGLKGSTKVIALAIDADLLKAIDTFSREFQMSRSSIVERLIRLGLKTIAVGLEETEEAAIHGG